MAKEKRASWQLPVIVLGCVCAAIAGFILVHSLVKGRFHESNILDLSLAREIQQPAHRGALHRQDETPYHYDFFALLDQPVPERAVPEFELAQNPAMKAKARHALNKITGKFAVQVSSFRSLGDAQSLARQLNAQGFYAVTMSETVKGETWYRVRVDGGAKREQAETLQANVQKKTGLKGFVVAL